MNRNQRGDGLDAREEVRGREEAELERLASERYRRRGRRRGRGTWTETDGGGRGDWRGVSERTSSSSSFQRKSLFARWHATTVRSRAVAARRERFERAGTRDDAPALAAAMSIARSRGPRSTLRVTRRGRVCEASHRKVPRSAGVGPGRRWKTRDLARFFQPSRVSALWRREDEDERCFQTRRDYFARRHTILFIPARDETPSLVRLRPRSLQSSFRLATIVHRIVNDRPSDRQLLPS